MMKRTSGTALEPKELYGLTTNHFISCYMFLAGFAIENLVKDLLVARSAGIKSSGRLPKSIIGHNLMRLFDDVGIVLNADEKRSVDELSEAVLWKGRYRTPRHKDQLSRQSFLAYAIVGHHPKQVTALFQRVADQSVNGGVKVSHLAVQ